MPFILSVAGNLCKSYRRFDGAHTGGDFIRRRPQSHQHRKRRNYELSERQYSGLFVQKQKMGHFPGGLSDSDFPEQLHSVGHTDGRLDGGSHGPSGRHQYGHGNRRIHRRRNGRNRDAGRRGGGHRGQRHSVQARQRNRRQPRARRRIHARLSQQPRNAASKRHRACPPRFRGAHSRPRRSRQL